MRINEPLISSLTKGRTANDLSQSGIDRTILSANLVEDTISKSIEVLQKNKMVTANGNSYMLKQSDIECDPITKKPKNNFKPKTQGYSAGIVAAVVLGQEKEISGITMEVIEIYYLPLKGDNIATQKNGDPKYEHVQIVNNHLNFEVFKKAKQLFEKSEKLIQDGMVIKFDIDNILTFPSKNGGWFNIQIPSDFAILSTPKAKIVKDRKPRKNKEEEKSISSSLENEEGNEEGEEKEKF